MTQQLDLIEKNEITPDANGDVLPLALTPPQILMRAIERGADLSLIDKLMDMQDRWEDRKARQEFNQAITAAKAEIEPVKRTNKSHMGKYENLADISKAISNILAENGLSYRFRTDNKNGQICVTCIIAHKSGYSEENTLCSDADKSGSKNSIQAIGSAVTYLERYTLKAALGLSASHDDDGNSADLEKNISENQRNKILQLIEKTNSKIDGFCALYGINSVADLPENLFQAAKGVLENRLARMQANASNLS